MCFFFYYYIIFKHPVAFTYTSHTIYTVTDAHEEEQGGLKKSTIKRNDWRTLDVRSKEE
jgi:hypothetical protein